MVYQEKRSIINIISSLVIFSGYSYYVFELNGKENLPLINDFSFWGKFILVLIPVTIVSKIIIYIIFSIINTIATREDIPSITDERDKLIELKSLRNSHYIFVIGFLTSMAVLLTDWPHYIMFIILILSGLISEIFAEISKFYYYRKGV